MTQALLQTPANDLQKSLEFYRRLKFEVISEDPAIVSDGKAFILINPDRYARPGIRLYSENWEETVSNLKKLTPVQKISGGYLLSDFSGTWIYLVEKEPEADITMKSSSNSVLGNCMGVCLETIALNESAEIWSNLDFNRASPDWSTYMHKSGFLVTLFEPNKCPHMFFNPSFAYFNGDQNMKVIEQIRSLKIPITEEITYFNEAGTVDNIIIRDPGGLGFFLFND